VDEKALKFLEQQLSRQLKIVDKSRDLNEKLQQDANEWARRYRELAVRLANIEPGDANRDQIQATDAIRQGDFETAQDLLKNAATKTENDLSRAAQTQYDLGQLAALRLDAKTALSHYEKAFHYRPDNPRYAESYAKVAFQLGQYSDAIEGWITALSLYRELMSRGDSPETSQAQADLGRVLNSLGNAYRSTGQLSDAENRYIEALSTQRKLLSLDPGSIAISADLAKTLNGLARTYRDGGHYAEAERSYLEAL
jgi:tetratricopeptide (TPR) repeat protein